MILKAQVFGSSIIGVYLVANNSFVLYPTTILKPLLKKFKTVFDKPYFPLTINNSNLLGVLSASNKYGIILPHIIKDDEFDMLKGNLRDSIQIGILDSIDNAFGNLILCNDKGAIISTFLKDYRKKIEDILNVETIIYEFADSYLPGSISIANSYGCLVHPLADDDEIDYISSVLKVEETDVSTINRGMPYLGSGAVVNDNSGIFGALSTGPELQRLSSILQI